MALIKRHVMQPGRYRDTIAPHRIGSPGTGRIRYSRPAIQIAAKPFPRAICQQIDGVIINIHRKPAADGIHHRGFATAAPGFLQAKCVGADRIIYLARQRARRAPPEHQRKAGDCCQGQHGK